MRKSGSGFWVLGAGFWFGFLVLGSGFAAAQPPSPGGSGELRPQSGERLLVIPFENPTREARIYWIGEASAVLLADELNALGKRAYTREERLDAFERLQVPPVTSLSHATVIRLGQVVGATHVVIGSVRLTGGMISVRAQNIRLDTGRMEHEFVEAGPLDDLFGIFGRVGRRLGGQAAGIPPAKPALPVFENYIKGLIATATPAKITYLETAIKLDPGFDRARMALWSVHHDAANGQAALVAAAAVPETSPIYPHARFSVALSLIQLNRLDDAFATLRTLGDRAPSATLMNNIGVIQLRRPVTPQTGRATYYFNQALKLDDDDPDYYFNLGYAYWAEKDPQSSIFWLREAVRREPADGEAHAVLAAALQATGAAAESARERELATQLSSTYAEWAKKPAGAGAEAIPRGLERLKPSLEVSTLRRVDSAIAITGQREQKELATFHLDRGRRLFEQGSNSEAVTELARAIYLSPYEASAHLLLGRIYLRTGQTAAAIDAFKIALWSRESVEGRVALAQAYLQMKDADGAREALERALILDPNSSEAKELLGKMSP
jgi:predicted Zn-dependent protease